VLAWDHPRATRPLAACSDAWARLTGEPFVVETRSLASFGDASPSADDHDLVLIDHPHIGRAATDEAIVPLDGLLDSATLAALASDSAGPSHASYARDGHQWAIPVDASCQALAMRAASAGKVAAPASWGQVLVLAGAHRGQVALPLQPAHAISALLSLLAAQGELAFGRALASPQALERALATLDRIVSLGPSDAFDWEPPDALARLEAGDILCVPLTYVYVGYAVEWHDAPAATPGGRPGSILGGVGAAVLSTAGDRRAAAQLAAWLGSSKVQGDLVAHAGGQPAARTAWEAADCDPALRAVTRTLEASRVRPNEPWWPGFQLAAGELLAAGLAARADPRSLASDLARLYHRHRGDERS
jgi:multiple sugar transport system substrate-binding protein